MCQEFAPFMCEMHAASQQVTGSQHLSRIYIRLREHPTTEQGGNLVRVDLVVFGLAAMDGFHRESMTEDKRDACVGTEVGEPVPGEHAFDGDHNPLSIRSNDVQEGLRVGFHVTVHEDRAALVEDADVHRSGMQVDAAVKWMLGGVEAHEVSSSLESDFPTTSIPPGYAGEGASISINWPWMIGVSSSSGRGILPQPHQPPHQRQPGRHSPPCRHTWPRRSVLPGTRSLASASR